MNTYGSCAVLTDQAGVAIDVPSRVLGITLTSTLAGNLSVTGVNNLDGSAASWTISTGQSGWQASAGNSGGLSNRLTFSFANAGDAGKAIVSYIPR
jgi:hypothetical protein